MIYRFFSFLGSIGLYLLACVLAGFGSYNWLNSRFLEPLNPGSQEKVLHYIAKGTNLRQIAMALEEKKVVRDWRSLYYLGLLRKDKTPLTINEGEYALSPGDDPHTILANIIDGSVVHYKFKVPPAITVAEVPSLLASSGLVSDREAQLALTNGALLNQLGITSYTLEGYVFAGEFSFARPITADVMLLHIAREGLKKIEAELPKWQEKALSLGLKEYEVLTLASIIEKESSDSRERRLISSVYHNRLRIGMPLQSNAALAYGIDNFNGIITQEHLTTPGPYNTYLNTGLPNTPICTPTVDSIRAVLEPEDTDFLYFVRKADGSHVFSATYKEHLQAQADNS